MEFSGWPQRQIHFNRSAPNPSIVICDPLRWFADVI